MDAFGQNFSLIVLPHNVSGFSTILHIYFAASALQKRYGFLIPQAPLDLGRTIFVHLTKRMPSFFVLNVHKNEKHVFSDPC